MNEEIADRQLPIDNFATFAILCVFALSINRQSAIPKSCNRVFCVLAAGPPGARRRSDDRAQIRIEPGVRGSAFRVHH